MKTEVSLNTMRKALRNGNILAFSLGLLVSLVLPQSWLVVVTAVILSVVSLICSRRCC